MTYSVGQKLIYTSPNGKKEKVTIDKRKVDYKDGFIDEPNYKGTFDYIVEVERNGESENIFCQHKELSKIRKYMGSLTFGADTAKDKYQEFLEEYAEFKNDETSIKKASNLANSAWHLVDWSFVDFQSIHNCNNIVEFRETLFPNCPSLKIMHDLANAKKHKNLTRPKANLKNTRKHNGVFSREFSSDFDISYLEIELENETKLSFEKEIDKVKTFWDNYFIDI